MTKRDKIKIERDKIEEILRYYSDYPDNYCISFEESIDRILEICKPKKINKGLFEAIKEELTKSLKIILPVALEKEVRKKSKPLKLSEEKIKKLVLEKTITLSNSVFIAWLNHMVDEGKDIYEEETE